MPEQSTPAPVARQSAPACIYALVDPFSGERRYVGKSIRPHGRLKDHCNDHSPCYRTHWIQEVLNRGGYPGIEILEIVPPGGDWREYEVFWIAAGRVMGWPLTNSTDGGDGVAGLSGESKERLAKTWVGRKHKPESLVRIGEASRGRKHTEQYKRYMRNLMRQREFTPDHRRRLSDALKKFTPEDIADIRRRLSAGELGREIAASYGVHRMTISRIKCGHIYTPSTAATEGQS